MAEETIKKAVSVAGSLKTKETADGERQIVFVASSNGLDRHYENVDVKSLRLPIKGGGEVVAKDIGTNGATNVDIPLMLNHSFDVTDVIGSVRKAYMDGDELVFEAGISQRDIAQDMLTLIDEGHLSNAFSITMSDFDYDSDTATISNAEVIEVSLVFRGANKEARLLAIKSLLGGKKVADEKSKKLTAEEARELVEGFGSLVENFVEQDEQEPEEEQNQDEETPAEESKEVEAPAEAEPAEEEAEEKPAEETAEKDVEPEASEPEAEPEEKVEEAEEQPKEEKEDKMEKSIAKENIAKSAPAQAVQTSDYLESKEALKDFRTVVLKNHRGSNEKIMKEWQENLSSKAISGDAILPARIEQIFFKTWVDNDGILSTFRQIGVRAGAVYAMQATANGTAQPHTKGATKVEQGLSDIRRDLKALGIYKKLSIDLQDLFDDETGELLAFRVEELAGRVAHAIAVGAIIGGYINNGRGLNSMVADLTASTTENSFAASVATIVEAESTDTDLDKAIRTLGAVKGDRKVLIVPEGWRTKIALLKNANGYYLGDPEEILNAEIFELAEMADSGYDMIAYARDSYVLVGENNATTRTDFDLSTNQDVMLVERYVGGSATGYKTVAGIATAD